MKKPNATVMLIAREAGCIRVTLDCGHQYTRSYKGPKVAQRQFCWECAGEVDGR